MLKKVDTIYGRNHPIGGIHMKGIPRQYYTAELKSEAVKLVRSDGLSIVEAGQRLGIPSQTLKNWVYRDG
jgi:transposase-like protein